MDDALAPPPPLGGDRLLLVPLAVDDAVEMADVLRSASLYTYIGGAPPSSAELRARYERQLRGPANADEAWLNWIVRDTGRAVGYMQATLHRREGLLAATIAWVVRPEEQGRGVATEAAALMIGHLAARGASRISASIADGNAASAAVARKIGLRPTEERDAGERVWELASVPWADGPATVSRGQAPRTGS